MLSGRRRLSGSSHSYRPHAQRRSRTAWPGTLPSLALLALLAVAGCSRPDADLVVTIGGTTTPGTPGEAVWLQFRRAVESSAAGTIRLKPLIYGQLGSEEQLLSGLRRGRIQYANLSAQAVSTVVPEMALLYAPYLFEDQATADYVYDRYLTGIYRELLAEKDLHLVTWYEIGFHHVYGKQPMLVPADVAGRRFRVSSALSARLLAESLGADVIPLGFGDVVPSLQTGLVEAGENSVSLYARTGIAGEAPHLMLTAHALGMSVILARRQWWQSLGDDQRLLLQRSFPDIQATRRLMREQDARDLAEARLLGITPHELAPADLEAWKRATAGVTPALIEALGGRSAGIYATIQQGRAEFAAQRPR
jgi:TRAP-type C4-dicarboxylate transport system substrate-binding protein